MSRILPYDLPPVLHRRFRIHRSNQIGQGSFGSIFSCTDLHTGQDLAVKVEPNSKDSLLRYEHHILKKLQLFHGFLSIYNCSQSDTHTFVVMTRLGPNLDEVWNENGRAFSLATLAHIGIQAVTLLERLHSVGFLHRDIKPENFLFSRDNTSQELFLIDFGLSKRFQREQYGEHIAFRTGKMMTGTPRYASVSAHLGMEQGRKDDLVSLFHVLVYQLEGHLPWMGMTGSTEAKKWAKIRKMKLRTSVESFPNLPLPLATFFHCVSALPFAAVPPYAFLRRLLLDVGRLDKKALTRYGSAVFSTEQRFLQTYRYEWMEECDLQTVLVGEYKDRPASPVLELELPKLKRTRTCSYDEGNVSSNAWALSKSTPLLPLLENGPQDNPTTDHSDDTKNDDRMSQISPNPKGALPPPAVHNPDSSSLTPMSSTFINQSIASPSPIFSPLPPMSRMHSPIFSTPSSENSSQAPFSLFPRCLSPSHQTNWRPNHRFTHATKHSETHDMSPMAPSHTLGKSKSSSILDTTATFTVASPTTKNGDISKQRMSSQYLHPHFNRNEDNRLRTTKTRLFPNSKDSSPRPSDSPIFPSNLFSDVSNVLPTHPSIPLTKNAGRTGFSPKNTTFIRPIGISFANETKPKGHIVKDKKQSGGWKTDNQISLPLFRISFWLCGEYCHSAVISPLDCGCCSSFVSVLETTYYSSIEIQCRLMESGLISKVLATVQPQTLPISGNEEIFSNLIWTITEFMNLLSPSNHSKLGITTAADKYNHREMVFQKVVLPSSQFMTFLISNRYILNEKMFYSFMTLLDTLFYIGPFHRPTLEFVLASPIVMGFSSCLSFVEDDDPHSATLCDIHDLLLKSQQEGGEVAQSGKRTMQALISEGSEDTLELMMKYLKDGFYGSHLVEASHSISQLLGSNAKRLIPIHLR
ncbi:putative Casein kinase I [Blattamonas nauphoetae]|uniref:non-specific serine/threonine protein kinase n=1 Tax=Blattamonas nauphoetae TaxID=2049346 RepID=A0ABQ9Y8V5_9EUKA|nr:putative Casein kinase I [Blattamonas nauphoetae]